MGAQGVVAKPEDDAMSYEKTYEQMFQSCNMSDEDFRALSKQHFEFAIKRADGKESDDDVPSIMPWLEVYYVTVEDETGNVSDRKLNVYALAVSPEEKYATIRRIGESLSERGNRIIPVAAFFTSEAWCSSFKPGRKHVRPIDDPNSKDAIILLGCTIDQRLSTARQLIEKKKGITSPTGQPEWMWWDEKGVKLHSGVLVPFWEGFFARFMPLAKELIKKAKEKENPNG
jgi:hypothetical protein